MSNNTRKIRLEMPEPCTANFEQMPDVGNGRFCDKCNKTVHDVAQLPDSALRLFLNADSRVCMQLHEDQLGRGIILDSRLRQSTALRDISVCILHDLMPGSILGIASGDAITHENRWCTGFLKEDTRQLPLSGAIIALGSLGIAFTDASGWFKLFVPTAVEYSVLAFRVSLNTDTDNYREVLRQSIKIIDQKVHIRESKTLSYHPFTKPTSIRIREASTLIQISVY